MAAGDSAAWEARRAGNAADRLLHEHQELARRARDFGIGASSERQLARTLAHLEPHGYRVFADRKWPARGRAQVDFIVVGPGGVFFIDAKSWREVRVERTAAGGERVLRGDADETESFEGFADLVNRVQGLLADRINLVSGEVHAMAVFTNKRGLRAHAMGVDLLCEHDCVADIIRRGNRLTERQVEVIEAEIIASFPPAELEDPPIAVVIRTPALQASEPAELFSASQINDLTVQAKLLEPIEEWMAFLDPAQSKTLRRSFNGPSRIRGAAGTGKTVLGLHRAAHLARSMPGRILVTTYLRTLPDVMRHQLRRLAPEVADRVDFFGVHEFAREILTRNGVRNRLRRDQAGAVFTRVWAQSGARTLDSIESDSRYWQDEIAHVIKGRGLGSFEQYAECARPGRQRRLTVDQKRSVWSFYEAYQSELVRLGIWDDADVILQAEALLDANPLREYSAVIVDEAQDLSCAMIRMLYRLVGDAPDGLTLIGDGQQTIYPGGFTLAEAGVSLSGRGVVLSVNYRNTVEIVDYARRLVTDDSFVDIDGSTSSADRYTTVRHGPAPVLIEGVGRARHDEAFVAQVRSLLEMPDVEPGDIGVLALYRYQVDDAIALLTRAGIVAKNLEQYRGERVEHVRVGTIKRAKGLEFKQVVVVRAPKSVLSSRSIAPVKEVSENRAGALRGDDTGAGWALGRGRLARVARSATAQRST